MMGFAGLNPSYELLRHMWTAPIGKLFFDVTNDLVSFSHMSGLLVRHDGRWP